MSRPGSGGCDSAHPAPERRPTPPTVVFIAGLGRSGTTVLERCIGEVAGACAIGELVHLWHRGAQLNERCGCGQPFSECEFWRSVGQRAFGGWEQADIPRVEHLRQEIDRTRRIPAVLTRQRRPGFAATLAEYTLFYSQVYRAVGELTGCDVIVDSSKHPSLAFCLSSRDELDLRVVHVVRDPRAVAYSWTKTVDRPEATQGVDDLMVRYSVSRSAMLWNSHNAALEGLRRTTTPTLTVRYEDFTAQPQRTLRTIVRWIGFPDGVPLPISADGVAELGEAHTVSGNPARFSNGQIPIAPREGWRTELPVRQPRTVTALTYPLLRRFGY